MIANEIPQRSALMVGLYQLLNPFPPGMFAAAWLCDLIYINSTAIFWTQAASWLIAFGLFIAIIPRLISLGQVLPLRNQARSGAMKWHFWLNALAIVLEIFNAFIHSRDAYAVVPAGAILSSLAVLCLVIAQLQLALRNRG